MIEDQPCDWTGPIGTAALRTEVMEDCLLAIWSELEDDAACAVEAARAVQPSGGSGPIQVSLLVEGQPCLGICPVGAAALRAEGVKRTFLLGPCRTRDECAKNYEHERDPWVHRGAFV